MAQLTCDFLLDLTAVTTFANWRNIWSLITSSTRYLARWPPRHTLTIAPRPGADRHLELDESAPSREVAVAVEGGGESGVRGRGSTRVPRAAARRLAGAAAVPPAEGRVNVNGG